MFVIDDSPNNLYMVGSMGCASSIGMGLAISKPNKKIISVDGDGAILMRMGALAHIGYFSPNNLLHIVLDNNIYKSTGAQKIVAHNVDFVTLANANGYPTSWYIYSIEELKEAINEWQSQQKLTFLYLKIKPGTPKPLLRPDKTPAEIARRLMNFLNKS